MFSRLLFASLFFLAGINSALSATAPLLSLDPGGHQSIIQSLAFTPDGKSIVSAGDDKVIRIWDLQAEKTVRKIRGEIRPGPVGAIYAMALSPDGRRLAVGGYMHSSCPGRCGEIRLYDFETGVLEVLLRGHRHVVQRLAFSADSKFLVSGSSDFEAIIWDVESGLLHQRLRHRIDVIAAAFTPDGKNVVTAVGETLMLWRVSDGAFLKEMPGHRSSLFSLDVSRDGTIASADHGGEIHLWDAATGEPKKVLLRQGHDIGWVRFSPDGKRLLVTSGRTPNQEQIFDVNSGELLTSYDRHKGVVLPGAFAPDGCEAAWNSDPVFGVIGVEN